MRKGTDWKQVIENRERMINEVPHVDFYVSATVSAMNVLHVLDFHKDWTQQGLIQAKDFNINLCQSPEWYRPNIFPNWFKEQVIKPAYEKHIAWLEPNDDLRRATSGFKSLLSFIMSDSTSREIEIHEHEYNTMKGESWLCWKDFKLGKKTGNQEIDNEIEEFVKSIKETKSFREFQAQVKKLDTIRNENFWDTFPELKILNEIT
jgi:hypothetical protein